MDAAFVYCSECSKALLRGSYLFDSLNLEPVAMPEGYDAKGAASVRFFMDLSVAARRLMAKEIMSIFKNTSDSIQPVDAMSLQLWLPLLRESYRVAGYRDISPQAKIWCIYHGYIVATEVLKQLEVLNTNWSSLTS